MPFHQWVQLKDQQLKDKEAFEAMKLEELRNKESKELIKTFHLGRPLVHGQSEPSTDAATKPAPQRPPSATPRGSVRVVGGLKEAVAAHLHSQEARGGWLPQPRHARRSAC